MTKRNRTSRAKNKIEGPNPGSLIKADSSAVAATPQDVHHATAINLTRSTLFTAELEAVIEMIARERVYRAMLAGLGRHLLTSPAHPPANPPVGLD
jgi:hypothetical protein